MLKGNNGKETFKALINGYFKQGGLQHQPNILDVDETDIPEFTVNPPTWEEYQGEVIINPDYILSAETWLVNELVFESEKPYSDPFNDVDIELHLYSEGRLYKIPGFWDGGNIWRVRFALPTEGTWTFKTVFSDWFLCFLYGECLLHVFSFCYRSNSFPCIYAKRR